MAIGGTELLGSGEVKTCEGQLLAPYEQIEIILVGPSPTSDISGLSSNK